MFGIGQATVQNVMNRAILIFWDALIILSNCEDLELPLPKLKMSHADVLDSEVLFRVLLVAEEVTDTVEAYPSDNFTPLDGSSLLAMNFSTLLRAQGIKNQHYTNFEVKRIAKNYR